MTDTHLASLVKNIQYIFLFYFLNRVNSFLCFFIVLYTIFIYCEKTNKTWKNCSLIDNKTQLLKHLLITIKTSVQQRQVFHYRINMTHMRKNAHRIDQSLLNIKISLADLKKKGIVLTCIATRCANTIRIIWSHYLCSTRVTEFPSIKWLHIRFYYGQSQISSPLFFAIKRAQYN